MTDAVEAFRRSIRIDVRRSAGRSGGSIAFAIAFLNGDPVKARDVTSAIANLFIEDNLRLRESQAVGTTRFLDRELERMKGVLRQKEMSLKEFKEKYMGFLPKHMEKNYRMMGHRQQQLDSINVSIQQTKDRKLLLESQLGNLQRMEGESGTGEMQDIWESGDNPDGITSPALAELHSQLQSLKIRYSDKHPDVIKVKAAISKLEEEQAAVSAGEEGSEGLGATPDGWLVDVQRETFLSQIQSINSEIKKLQTERNEINREIKEYTKRIESGPQIEAMWTDLARGYDEADENHQSLLKKKLAAELAENLERAQQGEQFKVLDPASLPEKPFSSNPGKILFLGFVMAVATGLGLAFLLEYIDLSFWSSEELETTVEMPVLVSVPVIKTASDLRKNSVRKAGAVGALVSMACILLFALLVLWNMDSGGVPPAPG
jgi:polysaccharide chain length determinant protein (PEP-CTERM system associated)